MREDGDSLVLKIDPGRRNLLMREDPKTFYITHHYGGYPLVQVRLSSVHVKDLRQLIKESWRRSAPKRRLEEFDRR